MKRKASKDAALKQKSTERFIAELKKSGELSSQHEQDFGGLLDAAVVGVKKPKRRRP